MDTKRTKRVKEVVRRLSECVRRGAIRWLVQRFQFLSRLTYIYTFLFRPVHFSAVNMVSEGDPSKLWYISTKLHGVTYHKTVIFIKSLSIITVIGTFGVA